MTDMLELRDPIYGDIQLYEYEMSILDTVPFQRLRRLKQLPFVDLVYPTATHSRFSHCLGVMELAGRIAKNLELPEAEIRLIRVAALLHDIEEPPFYSVTKKSNGGPNNIQSELIEEVLSELQQRNMPSIIDPEKVITILQNVDNYGNQIIFSPIGANRLDFLIRDSFFCGVKYGNIDLRILSLFKRGENQQLLLREQGIPLAEAVFCGLYQMKLSVYDHKIVRSAVALVKKSTQKRNLNLAQLAKMDDKDFLGLLDKETLKCLENRNLPKMAYRLDSYILFSSLSNINVVRVVEQKLEDEKVVKGIQNDISSSLGVNPESILVEFMSREEFGDLWKPELQVEIYDTIRPLSDASGTLSTWRDYFIEQWRMFVFCNNGDKEFVNKKCREIFSFFETKDRIKVPSYLIEIFQIVKERGITDDKKRDVFNKIMGLNQSKREVFLSFLELNSATVKDVMNRIGKKRTTVNIILNNLAEEGLLEKRGTGKRINYQLPVEIAEILKRMPYLRDYTK